MARGFALPHPQLPKEANAIAAIMANFRAISDYLNKSGQVMFGDLDMNGFDILDFGQLTGGDAWATWDPTFTNVTLGTGGADYGRVLIIGKVVFWRMGFVLGTGGSVSGLIRCGYPTGGTPETGHLGASAAFLVGYGGVRDDNTGVNYLVDVFNDVDNAGLRMAVRKVDGTYTVFADASGTVPMTWADADSFNAYGWYELNT